MMLDVGLAMALFSFVMSVTPGPVNMICLNSGANFGVRATQPFVLGATLGFTLLLGGLGIGVLEVFSLLPGFLTGLKIIGTGFIIYMGIGIFRSSSLQDRELQERPGFFKGAFLQWLNPKAWAACLSGLSLFSIEQEAGRLLVFCLIYFLLCYVGVGIWSALGMQARRYLNEPKRLRWFNRMMGSCLIALSLYLFIQ